MSRELPRCEIIPLPEDRASFRVDGVEGTAWCFGSRYERPFFYPFNGPSGSTLTRMGHPGAANHDHHRSVWFAHHDVDGFNFWSNQTKARIRQKRWLAYSDGEDEAVMASELGWFDDEGRERMTQELVAAYGPPEGGERLLEFQLTFRPKGESVKLGKTNFGFLAVRVAKSLAAFWGGGELTNSEGLRGEKLIFGQSARWMDYSGTVPVGEGPGRKAVTEGITYFDHPANPRHPVHWHVREDGWMGASFCMLEPYEVRADAPLVLRYLLHAHARELNKKRAEEQFEAFGARPGFRLFKSKKPHRRYEVERVG